MAWTTVETPNAKYVLMFLPHLRKFPNSPKPFDALILEMAPELNQTPGYWQYSKLVKQAIEDKKQIWVTDVRPSGASEFRYLLGKSVLGVSVLFGVSAFLKTLRSRKSLTRRQFIKGMIISGGILSPTLLESLVAFDTLHSKEIKHHKLLDFKVRSEDLLLGKGTGFIRSAITAEKAESFLAKRLYKELGEKPIIAMAFGHGHYDIKRLLEHPEERKKILHENNLEKYLYKDYPLSFKFHLDEKGKIQKIEKFPETLKIKRVPAKGVQVLTRRELLTRMFGRRRLA